MVDHTNLNKACPKYPFPIIKIDYSGDYRSKMLRMGIIKYP